MVVDAVERSRFELAVDGAVAFSKYRRDGNVVTFIHTEVPEALEGRGIGSALAKGALDLVREKGERVIPKCPFIRSYIEKHPEYRDLVVG
ncbi:MAG TPA: GNAT family N-acetyltransferase [Polyangiaceae bacterium]|nr:GNAT family N-acetyltransferase [Polyangiaceae bacterium]